MNTAVQQKISVDQIEYFTSRGMNVLPVTREIGNIFDKRPVTYLLPLKSDELPTVTQFVKGDERGWAAFNTHRVSKQFANYWAGRCNALGVILGDISGRNIVLDVDAKNHPDENQLFADVADIMTDTFGDWSSFPLVKTPGGWHTYIKLSHDAAMLGSMKLAAFEKEKHFIEIKGQNSYVVSHVSPGYELLSGNFDDNNKQGISQAECDYLLNDLMNLGTYQDTYAATDNTSKSKPIAKWQEKDTPWDQYDQTDDFKEVLISIGWVENQSGSGKFRYWTRPGKDHGHSATWNSETRMFHVFSSNTGFPLSDKSYRPHQVLALLKFDGDFSASTSFLRSEGFGASWSTEQKEMITASFVAQHTTEDIKNAFSRSGLFHNDEIPKAIHSIEAKEEQKKSIYHDAPLEFTPLLDRLHPINFADEISTELKIETKKIQPKHRQQLILKYTIKALDHKDTGLMYNVDDKYFYIFCQFWQCIDQDLIRSLLSYAVEVCGINTLNHDHHFNDKLFKSLQIKLTTKIPEPDQTTRLAFTNGTLYVKDGVHSFVPEYHKVDYCFSQLPYEYDINAKAPQWIKFLNDVLPDPSVLRVYQEFVGYCLTKHIKLEKAAYIVGEGSNGKSVACDIITAALGKDNVSNMSMEALTRNNRADSMRLMIKNKLVNYSSENGVTLDTTMAKRLYSGEILWCGF